ncbi:histidine kinase, partial [Xanthomonas perforans]|nr:histidine kinase [Xanthomonas perforans]
MGLPLQPQARLPHAGPVHAPPSWSAVTLSSRLCDRKHTIGLGMPYACRFHPVAARMSTVLSDRAAEPLPCAPKPP